MIEKLKGFLDLKALLMVGSLFVAIITTYNTVGEHTTILQKHEYSLSQNSFDIVEQDKELTKLGYRVGSIENRQTVTDQKFEELNKSIIKLNETLVRLSTILEGNRMNNSK
ncbi:hypothetical protein [Aeromonas caviae]|uniref:hypothetical protein n=1 Tax=Aeromonas caviae TaxID=648 RepID=UPI0029DCEF67|nr:hypothetical protein [Aeromonas caviae]MDX7787395.1 hypothetical protein [Aeromonas caviae]